MPDLITYLSRVMGDVVTTVNGKLDPQSNGNCALVSATFTASNVEVIVPHTLGRVPIGRVVYDQTTTSAVYSTSTAWTAQNIYLASAGTGSVKLIVF